MVTPSFAALRAVIHKNSQMSPDNFVLTERAPKPKYEHGFTLRMRNPRHPCAKRESVAHAQSETEQCRETNRYKKRKIIFRTNKYSVIVEIF